MKQNPILILISYLTPTSRLFRFVRIPPSYRPVTSCYLPFTGHWKCYSRLLVSGSVSHILQNRPGGFWFRYVCEKKAFQYLFEVLTRSCLKRTRLPFLHWLWPPLFVSCGKQGWSLIGIILGIPYSRWNSANPIRWWKCRHGMRRYFANLHRLICVWPMLWHPFSRRISTFQPLSCHCTIALPVTSILSSIPMHGQISSQLYQRPKNSIPLWKQGLSGFWSVQRHGLRMRISRFLSMPFFGTPNWPPQCSLTSPRFWP